MSKQYGQAIPVDVDAFGADPRAWLTEQMTDQMPWLLVHADDGVIWGRRQPNGDLLISGDVFSEDTLPLSVGVKLRALTLQQAHVFGPAGEVRLWRTAKGFEARFLTDTDVGLEVLCEEKHLLWHQGRPLLVSEEAGFALLKEGLQAQRHAPPVIPQGARRPALVVRHYVDYDAEGQATIALSRLAGLEGGRS